MAEDEETVRKFMGLALEAKGYSVLLAANGEEALHSFEGNQERIKLVISDMVMPKLGGRELYLLLRATCTGLKFLFVSGYAPSALSQGFLDSEGLDLLRKPFSPLELARKVRDVLDRGVNRAVLSPGLARSGK